jgi:hypothetical protein
MPRPTLVKLSLRGEVAGEVVPIRAAPVEEGIAGLLYGERRVEVKLFMPVPMLIDLKGSGLEKKLSCWLSLALVGSEKVTEAEEP